jgi:hypothetical protein
VLQQVAANHPLPCQLISATHAACCLSLALPAEDDATGGTKKKGAAGKGGAKGGGAHKPPKSRWQQLSKLLFGWASTTFKVNGKKLLPHNAVLWRFMVRRALQQRQCRQWSEDLN